MIKRIGEVIGGNEPLIGRILYARERILDIIGWLGRYPSPRTDGFTTEVGDRVGAKPHPRFDVEQLYGQALKSRENNSFFV